MKLRYLGFSNLSPSANMAVDEMLFRRAGKEKDIAVLRFFTFNKKCISTGRNQMLDNLPDDLKKTGLEIVRRPTGGGAVIHNGDLCYCLILPEAIIGLNSSLMDSYRLITEVFRYGFKLLGVSVEYGVSKQCKNEPLCFARTLTYELSLNGQKIVGSAQRRAMGILLQQGSIQNDHGIPHDKLINALLESLRLSLNAEYLHNPLTQKEIEAAALHASDFIVKKRCN